MMLTNPLGVMMMPVGTGAYNPGYGAPSQGAGSLSRYSQVLYCVANCMLVII